MKDVFEPRLFLWQFGQLWKINLWATVVVGVYAVIRVVPFFKPELLLFSGIVIHSALVVRKLGSSSVSQSTFLYSMGFTRDQIWWQTLFASLASAALVCGTVLLLILLNIRPVIQEHWFQNPYFPTSATKELWMPVTWMFSYILVIPLIYYAVIRAKQAGRNPNSGWATMLVGLGIFGWYTLKMAAGTCTAGELCLFASCHIPAAIILVVAGWRMHGTMELAS